MSLLWPHASKQNPCPVCQREDWCQFGDRAILCRRVPSSHPHKVNSSEDGWYHFYESNHAVSRPEFLPGKKEPPKEIDAFDLMAQFTWHDINTPRHDSRAIYALEIGVSYESIQLLRAATAKKYNALAFPMSDGNEFIGIRLRNERGFKWAIAGSRQGIFLPSIHDMTENWKTNHPIAYIPEGPTDTAALLTCGLYAIGRPSCNGGAEYIKVALKRLGIKRAVIVADNDDLKTLGPREGRPGIEGAERLKKELGIPSVIYIPPSPCKDVRDMLRTFTKQSDLQTAAKQTRFLIESAVSKMVWTMG